MGGPYDTGSPTSTMKSWNRQTMAHNVVRCVVPEPSTLRDMSGQFQAFGSSAIADYVVGQTPYGPTSIRHMVMMKGEYLVVWDQITAATYSEWFFHTPAQSLEWQAHKVVSHTAWNVDLDIHFLLPAAALPAPTVASPNISVDYTTRNALASEAPVPTTAKLYTGQGEGRFGNWTDPADTVPGNDNWDLKWLKYLFVRSPSADGDYLTVMQPRKVGVTPALATTLVSSSATGVSLTVNYNGRVDEIVIDTNGATVTKGGETVQFAKAVPQSGVSGAARYVLSNNTTTTLTNALTTTGAVDVVTGTLALGKQRSHPRHRARHHSSRRHAGPAESQRHRRQTHDGLRQNHRHRHAQRRVHRLVWRHGFRERRLHRGIHEKGRRHLVAIAFHHLCRRYDHRVRHGCLETRRGHLVRHQSPRARLRNIPHREWDRDQHRQSGSHGRRHD